MTADRFKPKLVKLRFYGFGVGIEISCKFNPVIANLFDFFKSFEQSFRVFYMFSDGINLNGYFDKDAPLSVKIYGLSGFRRFIDSLEYLSNNDCLLGLCAQLRAVDNRVIERSAFKL